MRYFFYSHIFSLDFFEVSYFVHVFPLDFGEVIFLLLKDLILKYQLSYRCTSKFSTKGFEKFILSFPT